MTGLRIAPALAAALLLSCASTPAPTPAHFEIVARGLAFEAPSRVPAGWITFALDNQSEMVHFALLQRLPDGIGIEDHQSEVAPPFQQGMHALIAGDSDAAGAAFAELPAWYGDFVFLGGPGLVSGGRRARTTVHLDPGTYLIECYVKTGGVFHSFPSAAGYGMVHEFEVTGSAPAEAPSVPAGDLDLSISSRGIAMEGEAQPGPQRIRVHFAEQAVQGNFVGFDVHLARLAPDTDLAALDAWMNWMNPRGLDTPAPVEFLGGTNEMPAGSWAVLEVDLAPGRYAWIAETDGPGAKGMLAPFEVR